jgi:vibriolysin
VTQATAALVYQNLSGAINESHSDIFASFYMYTSNNKVVDANTWLIGRNLIPGIPVIRYMNNPTQDGQSADFFPERRTDPVTVDNGNVHTNSGIGNLGYYLLVQGGTHPRGKTTDHVTGIGMDKAIQIAYRAQTTYESANNDYAAMRTAWAQAATDLFGATSREENSTERAFAAVGVGTAPPELPPDPGPTTPGTGGSPKDDSGNSGGRVTGGCSATSQPASDIATLLFALALAVIGPGARRGRRSERHSRATR